MRVLFVTSEVYPIIKTGGLADVSASLPEALCSLDIDVRVLLPAYPAALRVAREKGSNIIAELEVGGHAVTLHETSIPGTSVTVWLVNCPALFDRPGNPYQNDQGEDWQDNALRYHLFARVAVLIALGQAGLRWMPDVVHCNDWQSGLVPALLPDAPQGPATVFTIHNLAYQGLFSAGTFRQLELPESLWNYSALEFHGRLSFIKGGLVFSDRLTTVSPAYAREIQQPEFGYGLDGLLRHRASALAGVLNGIDTRIWNPENDHFLDHAYGCDSLENKQLCRADLQRHLGLDSSQPDSSQPRPVLGFIGRLVEQKGVDLLLQVVPGMLQQGCQVVVLGSGMPHLERDFRALADLWPGSLSLTIGYDEALAHLITAGADIFMMPSRFEPCGLNQMYSQHYGTVPVVHRVGGLSDTVTDPLDSPSSLANGFCFSGAGSDAFAGALNRALGCFQDPVAWRRLQINGMKADHSWQRRARTYTGIYKEALTTRRATSG
ncbi:glycogen synthase GlgA [Marinobacter sp.]|uniref:glycogen synthase GlgA n=1 Tax=Marinobacter sp. TaxID=50741 RepID=UPI00384CB4C5